MSSKSREYSQPTACFITYTYAKRVKLLTIKDLATKQFSQNDLYKVTNKVMESPKQLALDVSDSNLLIATSIRKWSIGKISSAIKLMRVDLAAK
jgi:hypothetical protein